jgi:MFS family permease
MTETLQSPAMIRTNIPFRLDRLPWSRFHLLVVIGLGITWILDGLEVTIVGSLGPALQSAETLHLSSANLGAVASFYVVGAVIGALVFGWITDRHGRRLVFYVTLIVYLSGVLLSAFAWDFWSFAFFRMITGLGIGGEYAAVNSAIDELIPAKYRGRVDLIVNGSFWLGAAGGRSPFRFCSISACSRRISAGASASASEQSLVWASCCSAASCPRARGG